MVTHVTYIFVFVRVAVDEVRPSWTAIGSQLWPPAILVEWRSDSSRLSGC